MTLFPVPVRDPDSAAFWEACARDELAFQTCSRCRTVRFPPSPVCASCRSWEHTWDPQPLRGRLESWVIVRHPVLAAQRDVVPYAVGLVRFGHGIRMPVRLVDTDVEGLREHLPLLIRFDELEPGTKVPVAVAEHKDIP